MLSTQSLREQLDRYADGSLSLDGLEEWLASESWDMRRWASSGLQRLVEAIQVAFIDFSDRKMSEDDLREFLLRRKVQLHRALEVTRQMEASRARRPDFIEQPKASVAGSQALMLSAVA